MRRVLVAAVLLLTLGTPAAAQQAPQDTLTAQQRVLMRLRNLPAVGQPDTLTVADDSIAPQGLRVTPRGGTTQGAPPSQIERDSIMARLLGLSGYVGTEYSADRARYTADSSRLELRGNPQVAREGNQLVADSSIIYQQDQALACGFGNPVLHAVGQADPLASDTVCFDVQRQVGRAVGASTRVQEGATWNVRCDAYFMEDRLYCHDALFTDCDLPYPHQHYAFHAGRLKAVRENVVVGTNVTMRFADVPVFWLPFFVQSLSRGRRSGILMPRFGINDIARNSSSYNRRIEDVGFYWAINDYMGAEFAMDWHSENWTSLRGSFDYNWLSQFLTGGVTYRHFWRNEGGTNFTLASSNSWRPDERTNVSLSANFARSQFVRQRTLDPRELTQSIASNAGLNRRFDWGNVSTTASRNQHLSDNTVTMTLPSLSVSFNPQTLFEALPGEERWYSNVTWSGSSRVNRTSTDVGSGNRSLQAQSRRDLTADVSSSLRLGRLGWSQRLEYEDRLRDPRVVDSTQIAGFAEERAEWATTLSFEQRLIGTSTLTPGISVRGEYMRNDSSGHAFVSAPMRIDFNSAVRLELFGYWPGVGPFQRFRHRVSPSISYNYSPAARADSLQRAIFGTTGVAEQNRISLGLTQTFEAKYREQPRQAGARDTAVTDTMRADSTAADSAAAPRRGVSTGDTLNGVVLTRRQQVQTVSLLAITTQALVYDFVQARDGRGLVNTQLQNSIQSDLMRGLQISFTHDLFESRRDSTGIVRDRSFRPHLSQVNASFSLNANSWLFRVLGLGRSSPSEPDEGSAPLPGGEQPDAGPAVDRTETELGLIGTTRRTAPGEPRGAVGSWNANINLSLFRPREGGAGENQMLTGNLSFQPTENWTVQWHTGYSFTESEFANHVLTLTRSLHDWDANFDFVKAQNGNFSFQFRVHLRANPDVKLDYSQSDMRGLPQQF